ncbi:MAG: TolC family protein [Planctomycetota bacterium]|jgi:outer membrane protein TolC
MNRSHTSGFAGLRRTAVALTCLGAAGCSNPFGLLDDETIGPSLEALREVDSIDLQAHSKAEPVTVEEAAEDALEELEARTPPPATADLELADVRAAALTNNLDLKVVLVNPSIADAAASAEEAKFEATFFGSARYRDDESPTASPLLQGTETTQALFDAGMRFPLVTGGEFVIDYPFNKYDTNRAGTILNPAYDAALRFSLSQPLLRGGGIKTNTHSIRVAQSERKIANAQTKLEAIRILANADRAYWLVYAARRQREVRGQQYELAVEQLEQAQRKVDAGEVAEIEVIRAQSGVASRLEDIIVAETILRQRQRNLKRILNRDDLPMASETELVLTTDPSPVFLDLDPVALGEYAIANRMEMLELELQLAIDASTIDFQKNAALPLVTLDYSYNLNGLDSSWGGANDQIRRSTFTGWNVGLSAEIPIGNEAAKSRVNQAILVRLQRLATKDQRRQAILQEVYNAVDLLNQEWQRILAARQAAILAGRTYEAERRQFEVGIRTSTDVLDAAARLADAQSSEVRALADYEIARVDIAFGTGTLLGHGRVHWTPTDTAQ